MDPAASPLDAPLEVLLVDEDDGFARLASEWLRGHAHVVHTVWLDLALAAIDHRRYDLVLVSAGFAGGQGADLMEYLRDTRPSLHVALYGDCRRDTGARRTIVRRPATAEELLQVLSSSVARRTRAA